MDVTIYHNPRCSKSRETLALLQDRGLELQVVNYLETPLDADGLRALLAKLGLGARALLRTGDAAYRELGLDDPACSEDELVQAMADHPALMQRPVVVVGDRARLGRPPEAVLDIVD